MGQITINNISGATPPYTVKVYQVGNNTPVFTDTTNTNNYSGTFSHTNGQSYYAVIENNECNSFTSGNSTLNCETCQLTASSLSYACYSSTHYTLTFNISGGDGNYVYSKNGGTIWSPVGSAFVDNIILGTSSILIAKSDFSCQTTVNLNSSVNPCELCFNLTYDSVNVVCVSGSTERKRVTMEISNNLTYVTNGCPAGDYQYSDDNGNTWITTVSSFNKVYDGYGANTIKLRYSLYPNKIWTVNVPAFNPSCTGYGVFTPSTCSCQINGGVAITGDWCSVGTRNFNNIPDSPSTYLASVSNPAGSTFFTPVALGYYSNPSGQPFRLVFSKTGGVFNNGTTTYDTGFISGTYLFQTSVYGGQSVSVTIRSQSGGINCASTAMVCGTSVASPDSTSTFTWDTCVYESETGNCTSCGGLEFNNNIASIYWNERVYI